MANPLVIVLVIAAADGDPSSTRALMDTVREATEPGAIVLTRETAPASDADVARMATALHADDVVVVSWRHDDKWTVQLRVLATAAPAHWSERELSFTDADPPRERGRAAGFAISSMLQRAEPPPPPPPTPPSPPAAREMPPPRPSEGLAFGVELLAAVAGGLGGAAPGAGVELAGRLRFLPRFALVAGGGFRTGHVGSAQATLTQVPLRAGAAWESAPLGGTPVALGARVDLGVVLQSLSRTDTAGQEATERRAVPFGAALFEGSLYFTPRIALALAAGPEVAFGATKVIVGTEVRDKVPPVRIVGELGLRVLF